MSVLKIKRVRENAKLPFRATEGSAGMDLYACIEEPGGNCTEWDTEDSDRAEHRA